MKNLKYISIVVSTFFLLACANRPGSIHASYVSHEKFADLTCDQLITRQLSTHIRLERLSREQDGKATGDAIGVFLLGIPFSKLSGDHEAEIAHLKGEMEALETAQVKAKCSSLTTNQSIPSRIVEIQKGNNANPPSNGVTSNPYARCIPHLNGSLGAC
jgi:hypothetical protein